MNLLSKRVLKQNTEPCNITKYKYLKDHHTTSLYNNIIFNITCMLTAMITQVQILINYREFTLKKKKKNHTFFLH